MITASVRAGCRERAPARAAWAGRTARRRHRFRLNLSAPLVSPLCSGMANKKRGRDDELPEGVQEALDSLSQTLDRESTEQKMRVRVASGLRAVVDRVGQPLLLHHHEPTEASQVTATTAG